MIAAHKAETQEAWLNAGKPSDFSLLFFLALLDRL